MEFLEFVALVLSVAGLGWVVFEIAVKDPAAFGEIATDCEKMARPEPRICRETRGHAHVRFTAARERVHA